MCCCRRPSGSKLTYGKRNSKETTQKPNGESQQEEKEKTNKWKKKKQEHIQIRYDVKVCLFLEIFSFLFSTPWKLMSLFFLKTSLLRWLINLCRKYNIINVFFCNFNCVGIEFIITLNYFYMLHTLFFLISSKLTYNYIWL